MKPRPILLLSLALVIALFVPFAAGASPHAPGSPTVRWVTISATSAELRADGITSGGVAGNGAIAWDIYFRYPPTVSAPYPTVSITPGPAWTDLAPCSFATNVTNGAASGPNATGTAGVLINGYCTTGIPTNPVTGDDVLVATVTLSGCPVTVAGFVMDLDSGDDVFGSSVAGMVDRNIDAHLFSDADLTDGLPLCVPSAVTLASLAAVAQSDHVLVTWETLSELGNAGFNLYRAALPAGPGTLLNSELIPSQGPGSSGGFAYSWQDHVAPDGDVLYYWLEAVDLTGQTTRFGPVSVTLGAPTSVGLNSFGAQAAATSWPLWLGAAVALAMGALGWRRFRRSR